VRVRRSLLDHCDLIAGGQKFAEAATFKEAFGQADGFLTKAAPPPCTS
jgi:hypothetical protein